MSAGIRGLDIGHIGQVGERSWESELAEDTRRRPGR